MIKIIHLTALDSNLEDVSYWRNFHRWFLFLDDKF